MQTFYNSSTRAIDVSSSGDTGSVLTVAPGGNAALADGNLTITDYTGTGPIGGGSGEEDDD